MQLIDCLMKTGLTKHESKIYITLCQEGEITGYEVAKKTGIPRANIYQALAGLVDKGGAYLVEGSVQRYTAVPVEEYCKNFMRKMESVVQIIKKECPTSKQKSEPYITISGFDNILCKVKNIIYEAKERIYISISSDDIDYIKDELVYAVKKGLKVVVITSNDPNIDNIILYVLNKRSGQIRLIADTKEVLTGDITGSKNDTCLYSKNKPLIELIKDSLKNEITLSENLK